MKPVLGDEIYAVWIDPFHNYLAIVCAKASGDLADATLIMSYSKADSAPGAESLGGAAVAGEAHPVRDGGGEPPNNVMTWEECVWRRIPTPDLSDMDRVHQVRAAVMLRLSGRDIACS